MARKPLSTIVAESLSEKIRAGTLAPGGQLPTEVELCAEYEVSRTVVREAVARLRSDGLIIPRQGRGMFVSEAPVYRNFSIPEDALKTLPETIALLELRMSVEVEAASLCADRRSDSDARSIRSIMERIDARHADPTGVEIHYDYDFHLAIAKATRNAFIFGFLSYLRQLLVPRLHLGHIVAADLKDAYYARIHAEHEAIVEAIVLRDGHAARQAMRSHLANSLERMRALALASGVDETDTVEKRAGEKLFAELTRPMATGS